MCAKQRVLGTLTAVLLLSDCASLEQQPWYNKARDVSVEAVGVASDHATKAISIASNRTSAALARMQHYLAEKDVLKTFYDAGEHSESVVLAVLHKAGVRPSKGGTVQHSERAHHTAAPPLAASMPETFNGTMQWPLEAGIVSSEFGSRWGKLHKGMDIAADVGEPVYAVAPGEVIYASDGMRGYGNVVILRHDRLRTTLYAHNSALKVKVGDMVARGALVALLGSTGHSTGPHVHFEIREGDTPIDPRTLLPPSMLADLIADPMPAVLAAQERSTSPTPRESP